MNDFSKSILIIIILVLTSCGKVEKRIVNSNDGKNQLTILKFEDGKYIINGNYNSLEKPKSDYIKSEVFYEYHTGLVKWTENHTEIYSQYGTYDTNASNGKIKINNISTKEFEELKKDTIQYTYFYY